MIDIISELQLDKLKRDLKNSRKHAYAEGTYKNLQIQWESFLLFCIHFGLCYLPVTTETLSLYAQFLSRSFKAPQSIKNYLSGVKTMHYLLGFSTQNINDFLINISLRGIERLHPHQIKQASPITPEILGHIYKLLDTESKTDSVFWCLFLFAFFLFARKSNLVPNSEADISKNKILLRKDIQLVNEMLIVSMRWSKTNQFGQRILQIPLLAIPESIFCPVHAYTVMCNKVHANVTNPLFSLPNGKCITYPAFQSKLKYFISKIGLNQEEFSTHSFRRGGTTFAFKANVPTILIKAHGDWKSDCYQKYLSLSLEDKLLVATHMKQEILLKSTS